MLSPRSIVLTLLALFAGLLPCADASASSIGADVAREAVKRLMDLAGPAMGQALPATESNALAAAEINRQLIHLEFHWGEATAYRGTQELSLGHFGQGAPDVFINSPMAHEQAVQFRHFRTASLLFRYSAMAVLVADLAFIINRSSQDTFTGRDAGIFYGLLGGGLVLSIVDGSLQQTASSHLARAIVLENEAVVNRTLGVAPVAGLYIAPVDHGVGIGAVARW